MTLQKTFLAPVLAGAVALVAIVGLTAFVHADTGTSITATVVNGSNTSVSSGLVGTPLQASVLVASSSTSTIPTGTVDFNLYSGTVCSGTPTAQTGVALNGSGSAQSATTTLSSGGLSYKVHYSGDANFTTVDSPCVPVTATQYTPTITTSLSQSSVLPGSTVYDTATLTNASSTAGGTVTYKAYTDNACTQGAMSAGAMTVNNMAVPNSSSLLFNTPGTYYWQAVYSGDAANAAATSSCGSEVLTVTGTQYAPIISIGLSSTSVLAGSSVYASSTITNASSTAGGTVMYKAYSDNACTLNTQNAGTVTVTNNIAPNSNSLQFNTAGTYYFQAVYSGDSTNAAATSSCASGALTVTGTTTQAGSDTISGVVFNDLNKDDVQDNGEPGLAGWTVWLHMAATSTPWWNWQGWGKHDGYNDPIIATATTDANGNYSFGNLGAGTYFVEEQEPTGWDQTSSDGQIILTSGNTSGKLNFSNVQKTNTGNGNGNNGGNGRGDGDNDRDDHATSTDHGGTGTTTWNGGGNNKGGSDNGNGWGNGTGNGNDKGNTTGDNGSSAKGNSNGSNNNRGGNNSGGFNFGASVGSWLHGGH